MDKFQETHSKSKKFLVFKLASTYYAIKLTSVHEVTEVKSFVTIPNAPSYVIGLMDLRGKVISTIDLQKKLNLPVQKKDTQKKSLVIVTEVQGVSFACLVDSISEVLSIQEHQIERNLDSVYSSLHHILEGIARFHDREMILILDMEKTVHIDDIVQKNKI